MARFVIEPTTAADDRGSFTEVYPAARAGRAWMERRVRAQRDLAQPPARHAARPALSACAALGGQARHLHSRRDLRRDRRRPPGFADVRASGTACELTPENRVALFLPEGVAHGYQTLIEDSTVHYHLSDYYAPQLGDGIRWDDPTLAIQWPLPPSMLSEQDRRWGLLTR